MFWIQAASFLATPVALTFQHQIILGHPSPHGTHLAMADSLRIDEDWNITGDLLLETLICFTETHKSLGISKKITQWHFTDGGKQDRPPTHGDPYSPGPGKLRTAPCLTKYLGYLGHKPQYVPFVPGETSVAFWRGKVVPKCRLSEHFVLSGLICRKAFSLPPKADSYRISSPAP